MYTRVLSHPIQTLLLINSITQLVTKLFDFVEQQTITSLFLGVDCEQCLCFSLFTCTIQVKSYEHCFKQGNFILEFQFTYWHYQFHRFELNFTLYLFGIKWPTLTKVMCELNWKLYIVTKIINVVLY